jgi:ketosteroid isomerase-like protein
MSVRSNKKKPAASKLTDLTAGFMQAFNDHDAPKALSFMSASPVWEGAVGPGPSGKTHSGVAAVRAAIDSTFKSFPDITYEILRTYEAGDSTICEFLAQSVSMNLKFQAADILTFDQDDKISIKRTYRKVVTPE